MVHYKIEGTVRAISRENRWPIFDIVTYKEPECYSYEIDNTIKSENLIISVTSFTGELNKLYVNPWNKINLNSLQSSKMIYHLHEEEIIKIKPEDRKVNDIETGTLYICIDSLKYYDDSFILNVIPESKVQGVQRFNFLLNGVPINGYLPSDKVTKYRVIDYSTNANITLRLETLSGEPVLYANVQEDNYEFYDKDKIKNLNSALFRSNSTGNIQTIEVSSDQNTCHQKNKLATKPNNRCGVSAIIYCSGSVECIYRISDKSRRTHNLLKEQ